MGKRQAYTRAGIVAIADVLPAIAVGIRKKAEFCGHVVNVSSLRLQTFVKSTVCSCCGLAATHFAVEHNDGFSWHLNLWADRSNEGKGEMLFTHDHTLARCLGGADDESNVTTMCAKCNHRKGFDERIEYHKLKGLPPPGTKQAKKKASGRGPDHDRKLNVPMELAVLQFRAAEERLMKSLTVAGKVVRKHSGNPFKSGSTIATVEAMCTSLMDPKHRLAYVLVEDQTIVSVHQCTEVN